MLDQRIKERMAADEAARFMDGNFGQLDLSGSPGLAHPPTEVFELQVIEAGRTSGNQVRSGG